MTISAYVATRILSSEIEYIYYVKYKFWVETTQNWIRKILDVIGTKTATFFKSTHSHLQQTTLISEVVQGHRLGLFLVMRSGRSFFFLLYLSGRLLAHSILMYAVGEISFD